MKAAAAGLVLALTATSFADLTFVPGGAFPAGPDVGDAFTLTFARAPSRAALPFVVWTGGAATSIDVTDVQWTAGAAPRPRTVGPTTASADAAKSDFAGLACSGAMAQSLLTFQRTAFAADRGSEIAVDAVSNPEPCAAALFAFGAACIGGLAWKTRQRVRAARRSR